MGWSRAGPQAIPPSQWRPYQLATVVTPPFPEYFSGHSIFSAAGAEVLRSFTGSDALGVSITVPKDSFRGEPGCGPVADLTLSFPTFRPPPTRPGCRGAGEESTSRTGISRGAPSGGTSERPCGRKS